VRRRIGMLCLQSPIVMVSMLATSLGLYGHCSWRWDIASPHSSSEPLAHTCGDLQEAYDGSYPPHPPSGRGFHTKANVQGRHERGSPRSFDYSVR
jgi:hypothetical protein